MNKQEKQQLKTINLVQKYELDKMEELVLIEAIKHDYPFDVTEIDLEKELERLNIDSTIKLKKLYKGLRVQVLICDTGYFEGTILTINQGEIYLEVDDFFGAAYDCVDYSDCYQGVHTFGIDDIYQLSIKE
ncbi:hypothetical protein QF028_002592 [Neobacillus sp. B4I6]|uniref:hypothetical protein n=1 Tax=Neobacillus sp. B4I6 TaxID=3373925 RepID=UPI003D25E5C2